MEQHKRGNTSQHKLAGSKSSGFTPRDGMVLGIVVILCGVVFWLSTFAMAQRDHSLIESGVRVQGTVETVYSVGGKSAKEDVVISYSDVDHLIRKIRLTSTNQFDFKHPNPRDSVTVYYDKDNPEKAIALGWEKKFSAGYGGLAIVLGGVGIVLVSGKLKRNLARKTPN